MSDKIMTMLASVTGGKSYRAHKYGLDHAERPFIDYGEDSIIWERTAETNKTIRRYEVFNLAFKKIYDSRQNLLAWLWIGVSHFKAVISKDCQMRGLRLRKENIQIGDDDALQKLFKEDRGHHYFIGEVFAVSKNLIPNSQRDYFNENSTRLEFEQELRRYFNGELYKIYYEGSAINSAYSKIDHPISDPKYFRNRDYIGKHWNRKFIRSVQAVLNSTKGKIGRGVDFFEEAFGRDVDEFKKILWMPETFIIYRRVYDANLRERLADRYTGKTAHDCDLANEWWAKFSSLPSEKAVKAKEIISLNKFKDGDFVCNDQDILDILSYYRITRDDAEG